MTDMYYWKKTDTLGINIDTLLVRPDFGACRRTCKSSQITVH